MIDLRVQNQCLLTKWLVKLCNEDGIWQQLIKNKYLKHKPIGEVTKRATDSHFWKSLMNIKDQMMQLGKFKVNSGAQTRFWEDIWIGNTLLQNKFPGLYNIVRKKYAIVAQVLSSNPLNIFFRRPLVGNNLQCWHRMVASVVDINLGEPPDRFIWSLDSKGVFIDQCEGPDRRPEGG